MSNSRARTGVTPDKLPNWKPEAKNQSANSNVHRQVTFGPAFSTLGNTTTPRKVAQVLVDKKLLARDGDVIRVHFGIKKNGVTDNAFALFYFGTTGEIATDVAVNSSATTALSGATDAGSGTLDFMRVSATSIRRLGNGTLLNTLSGNGAPDIPADFTVPNMNQNDLFLTLGAYTATAGGVASAEIATITSFEVEKRPFR
ncbi:hypothetical protein [Methyloversatilis sp.]|uniref:hypothetical protein n=1 Tax=Methyloversatilis sp. TaxID=2569862 RepID=UPI0027355802|nr:hypothetical protein [Methyloversatilis sp.]MDP3579132.1 hypothetical protein [Methyloversatilis sp.]